MFDLWIGLDAEHLCGECVAELRGEIKRAVVLARERRTKLRYDVAFGEANAWRERQRKAGASADVASAAGGGAAAGDVDGDDEGRVKA